MEIFPGINSRFFSNKIARRETRGDKTRLNCSFSFKRNLLFFPVFLSPLSSSSCYGCDRDTFEYIEDFFRKRKRKQKSFERQFSSISSNLLSFSNLQVVANLKLTNALGKISLSVISQRLGHFSSDRTFPFLFDSSFKSLQNNFIFINANNFYHFEKRDTID